MKKGLLLLFTLLLTVGNASAQEVVLKAPQGLLKKNPNASTGTRHQAPMRITLPANQQILGAYDNDALATGNNTTGFPDFPGNNLIANLIPVEDIAPFEGGKIVKMRVGFGLPQTITSTFFIRPIDMDGKILDNVASVDVNAPKTGWNMAEFEEPYTITTENISGLLIGFNYNQVNTVSGGYYTNACYPLSIVDEGTRGYDILLYGKTNNKTAWYNMGTGSLSVQCFVEGNFESDAAAPADFDHVIIPLSGQSMKVVSIHNMGTNGLSSIDYTITANGVVSEERHADLPSTFKHFNGYTNVALTFDGTDEETQQERIINITKVNGKENPAAAVAAKGLVASTDRSFTHRVAVEQFTGTDCGWCPRGHVGMKKLREDFGDLFVGVAIHQYNSSDPMYISYYPDPGFSGAPSCMLDRLMLVDPYFGESSTEYGIYNLFKAIQAMTPEIGVEAFGEWNADSTKITATAEVEGIFDGLQYNVELSLVADSLTGTAASWKQANYLYSYMPSQWPDDLAIFCKGGEYGTSSISGWKFNDVAIATSFNLMKKNRAPAVTINGKEKAKSSCSLTLPTKAALKEAIKKDQIFVVAIVTDQNKRVINSAKYHMPAHNQELAAVTTVQAIDMTKEARYSIDGRQLSTPKKGLNIIRMADGSTRKVIVR